MTDRADARPIGDEVDCARVLTVWVVRARSRLTGSAQRALATIRKM
jgi:hypothetical protein